MAWWPWQAAIAAVSCTKILLGLIGYLIGSPPLTSPGPARELTYALQASVFGVVALYLIRGARADRRAGLLGVVFVLTGSTFADRLLLHLAPLFPSGELIPRLIGHVQVEAFLPFVFWCFAVEFPRVPLVGRVRRSVQAMTRVALAFGLYAFVANLVYGVAYANGYHDVIPRVVSTMTRYVDWGSYHIVMYALMVPILPFLLWKRRRAQAAERRRVTLLLGGIVLGSGPMFLAVIVMGLSMTAREFLSQPTSFAVTQVIVYGALLSVPFTTAYAVQFQGALNVKLVVRRAVQYLLARYTVIAATAVPLMVLSTLLFLSRAQPLTAIVTGPLGLGLMGFAALGTATMRVRTRLLTRIDRRFFREQYDAHKILHDLVDASKLVPSLSALLDLTTAKVDEALHVESAHFLTRSDDGDSFVSRDRVVRSLDARSALADALLSNRGPLEIDLQRPNVLVGSLPASERQWLADHGTRLIVPWIGSDRTLTGILLLGDKRSELPFTREDQMLLQTFASSTASDLEQRLAAASTHGQDPDDTTATICNKCGSVVDTGATRCPECAASTVPADVPRVVAGKFRIEKRIGAGGMGVVYRAEDIALQRKVAIKTLPRVTPALAMRLRREARAMAAVVHPNLATIYGVEFCYGMPMLVFEYMSGGNLADGLKAGPYSLTDALNLGLALSSVADRIHAAGILHRDIKPSNIGFSQDGAMKLLDFGLARTLEAVYAGQDIDAPWRTRRSLEGEGIQGLAQYSTTSGLLLGTVAYMSPEALDGGTPDPSFDVWSISVVLYEAATGRNPFKGRSVARTIYNVSIGSIPDPRDHVQGCPTDFAEFLMRALSHDRSQRPATAQALANELVALRERL